MESARKNVKIVVLGDIGHSPRMTNHALSLAKKGHTVDIVGYGESEPAVSLKESPNIYYHYLTPCPKIPINILNYIWKTFWTSINLFFLLLITRKADVVLVQNPPAIPSLYVSWLYCKIIRAKLVIDWHNYAHTIMALSVGNKSPLVYLTKMIEFAIGRRSDHNFCVSNAMKDDLKSNYNVESEVLYDCPSERFSPLTAPEKHEFLLNLCEKKGFEILKTEVDDENSPLKSGFVVTSTSWTADEDFSIFINALQEFEDHWSGGNSKKLPNLIVAITGKGPLKQFYCDDIASRNWSHIKVITPWLEAKDYSKFIGCADLAISLHTSSSGLDLPMKIVDFFGCCVPVLAINFKALNELVRVGKNGRIFNNQKELANMLQAWFSNFPNNSEINDLNKEMHDELNSYRKQSWEETWEKIASPVF